MKNGSMRKQLVTSTLAFALLLAAAQPAMAQDVATFVNLGFSDNNRIFMFGQYGITRDTGRPFAELYTVDVPRNVFVNGGVFTESYSDHLSPGQDGLGALFKLLPRASHVVNSHGIDHLRQGRLVYLLVNGQEPKANLEFRDFETGNRYTIRLMQEQRGTGPDGSAAFHIELTIAFPNGVTFSDTVGRPTYYRDGINGYQIKQVLVAPDERSLVFVVEKLANGPGGRSIRYMVETVTFR